MRRQEILDMPTMAVYSGLNGIEVKDIEYGIEDYLLLVSGSLGGKKEAHRLKIHYDNKTNYVKLWGHRIPLNECMKVNF